MRARLAVVLIVVTCPVVPALARAQTPVESARALVARSHEDPTAIDPNSIADWTVKDRPRALELLASLKGK